MTEQDHAERNIRKGDLGHRGKHPVIPPGELRCVWMAAGILSYQLCELEFVCEKCPLDLALRQRFASREAILGCKTPSPLAKVPEEQHEGMLYSRKHVWGRSEGANRIRIGIEQGFVSVLLSPKAVVLPALGQHIVRNKVCSWIVIEGGTVPIISPVGGKVIAINTQLAENPHTLCLSPLGQGWLFELSVDAVVAGESDLFPASEVARVYADDERRFKAMTAAELMKGASSVGLTLADGGRALDNILEMLGPVKYFRLVRNVYT